MLSRRRLLEGLLLGACAGGLPRITFGSAGTDARFVLVILRGAMDGLALAPPYGDGHYAAARGELAIREADALHKLDGLFGLHPSLPAVHALYRKNEALIAHAVASPYRERSHFDGQDVLENGVVSAGGRRDGWLNRALRPLGGALGNEAAIALAQNTPLVLRGAQSVTSWAPSGLPDASDDTLARLAALYADDEFFRVRLAQALDAQAIAGTAGNAGNAGKAGRGRGNDRVRFTTAMKQAAKFLGAADGPRIAVLESGGWDTHANQGAALGALANKFAELDAGLAALTEGLGPVWRHTIVVVATEFGRTVAVNGTRGTDHGTASAVLVAGGAIAGGRVVTDWPGLATGSLYQGRDLHPTTDIRSVFKAIVIGHLGVPEGVVENEVFPESSEVEPLEDLFA